MVPFHQTYASWIAEIAPVVAQRDVVYDLGTFCFLILLLYLFETISFRFVCAGGLGHKLLRYLLAPGVLIHEIGHFCVALLSGFRDIRLTLLPDDRAPNVLGHVEFRYRPGLMSYLGLILTAIAPLPFGILSLLGLVYFIDIDTDILLNAPNIWELDAFVDFMRWVVIGLLELPWWQSSLFLYLYLVITLTMMPSFQDIRSLLKPLLFVSALLSLLAFGLSMTSFTIIPFLHYSLLLLIKGLQICLSASFVGVVFIGILHSVFIVGRLLPSRLASGTT